MEDLWIDKDLVIPAGDLAWDAVRGSGPGGQHVNKVSTKVELRKKDLRKFGQKARPGPSFPASASGANRGQAGSPELRRKQ